MPNFCQVQENSWQSFLPTAIRYHIVQLYISILSIILTCALLENKKRKEEQLRFHYDYQVESRVLSLPSSTWATLLSETTHQGIQRYLQFIVLMMQSLHQRFGVYWSMLFLRVT